MKIKSFVAALNGRQAGYVSFVLYSAFLLCPSLALAVNTHISGNKFVPPSNAALNGTIAIGKKPAVLADDAIAIGYASAGDSSVAMGFGVSADGEQSVAIGFLSEGHAKGDVAIGYGNNYQSEKKPKEAFRTTIGTYNMNMGHGASTFGFQNHNVDSSESHSHYSTVVGAYNNNFGERSTVVGFGNMSAGYSSIVIGGENNWLFSNMLKKDKVVAPTGDFAINMGISNVVSADGASSFGHGNVIVGRQSLIVGDSGYVASRNSFSFGRGNQVGDYFDDEHLENWKEVLEKKNILALGNYNDNMVSNSVSIGSFSGVVQESNRDYGYDPYSGMPSSSEAVSSMYGGRLSSNEIDENSKKFNEKIEAFEQNNIKQDELSYKVQQDSTLTDEQTKDYAAQIASYQKKSKEIMKEAFGIGQDMSQAGVTTWKPQFDEVSVGSAERGITRRITNVAAGLADTDVVNVAQLKRAVQKGDQQYRSLNAKIDHTESRMRKFSNANAASALATANIPQVYAPGKNAVGVGLGNMNGQSAVAVGISTINDKGDWIFKGTATVNSEGQGFGGGVSYVW